MNKYAKADIEGAMRWLGHQGNASLAMALEHLDDLDEEQFGSDEVGVLRECVSLLRATVPEPVQDAAFLAHRKFQGDLEFALQEDLKRQLQDEEPEHEEE
jgi:hypothetical protein